MFKVGDAVVVNAPWKNFLDSMSRYNSRAAIISGAPRVGWYELDGAPYLNFREDWLSPLDPSAFKFSIGDIVTVSIPASCTDPASTIAHMQRYDGYEGTIEDFWAPGTYALSGTEMAFDETWLKLVPTKEVYIEEMWLRPADEKLSLHVPGAKDDADKPPVDLVFSSFPRAFLELARVAGDGAKKYTRDGWVHVEDGEHRYADAAGRHALKRWIEGDRDSESGHLHLAHQAWNILAVLELELRKNERTSKAS